MPFVITPTDTASIAPVLSVVQNAAANNLYDVFMTTPNIQTYLTDGIFYRIIVTQPGTSTYALTNTVSTINGGNGTNASSTNYTFPGYNSIAPLKIATVRANGSTNQVLQWAFKLQQSPDGSTSWTEILQITPGTQWTFQVAGVDRVFSFAYATGITVPFITASTGTAGPQSGTITIDSATYTITGTSGALGGPDYRITFPEETTIDNTNITDVASATIPFIAPVDLASATTGAEFDGTKPELRGTSIDFPSAEKWANAFIKSYKVTGGSVISLGSGTTFTPAGKNITYNISTNAGGFATITAVLSGASAQTSLDSLIIGVD